MTSTRKTQNVFAHSPSLQILWKCAGQRRLVTKALINSASFKTIYKDVLQYVNSTTRRRSPLALILDSHLMLGLTYIYSKSVILWHQDVEKLYKDAVVQRFFEFTDPTKAKLTRKKEAILTSTPWQVDIDENLLPDERMLLERDFSIEIPRQTTPPVVAQSPDNLPPLPWEVSKPTHGKRITLLPDIEEPAPKFDIVDDRFGEPLPVPPITAMDIDDRTFFRAASEERETELLRAPRADRHLGAADRPVRPSEERTIDEHRPPRPTTSDLPPLPILPMDTTTITPAPPQRVSVTAHDQFITDALAFINGAIDTYPLYSSTPTKTVLLSADCIASSSVPLIFVQEPTVIGADEMPVPMDVLPPLDQQLPGDAPAAASVDAQVPNAEATSEEKEYFRVSKKKRNAPNALNKKRKNAALYEDIIGFDYGALKEFEEEEEAQFENNKRKQKPWPILVGRNGTKRMGKLLEKAKVAASSIDLGGMLTDIATIARAFTHPEESDVGLAEVRRTGQEMAIRRGQSSGLLPKAGTRSPSSIVPTIQDRMSQLPPPRSDGEILPPLPSGFDDLPIIPPAPFDPMADTRQPLSPLQTKRRGRSTTSALAEPSPTWQDKQKQKAIEDILGAADGAAGASFNAFLKRSDTTRIQAARLFSVLLVLCGERRVNVDQPEPYGDISIFINDAYDPTKHLLSDVPQVLPPEAMESDDSHF